MTRALSGVSANAASPMPSASAKVSRLSILRSATSVAFASAS